MLNTIVKKIQPIALQYRHRLGLVIIGFPMALLTVYYLLIATSLYVSESKVVVKRATDGISELAGISLPFLGGMGGGSNEDALQLKEFILSQDMLERLDKQLELRQQYSLNGLDVFNKLLPWAKKEDFLELYRGRVGVDFDEKTGILAISTSGSSAEDAQKLNQALLQEAEKFINELSHKIAREQVDFSSQELMQSRQRLEAAKDKLLGYQNKNGDLNPAASAEVATGVIAGLQSQLASKEVELNTLSSMLQSDAAQVVAVRQSIAGFRRQIEIEKRKLASPKAAALNRVAADYLDYKSMLDFQTDLYRISLAANEKLRIEAVRKVKSLAVIVAPQLPERAAYPRRIYMLIVWLFGLSMLFGLVKLTIEIIEDHRD